MRMRQSLAELEQDFLFQVQLEQQHQERIQRTVALRARQRWHAREKKRSSKRFYILTFSLVFTGVLVTAAMLATLYLLLS